jgi:hypothetical protein
MRQSELAAALEEGKRKNHENKTKLKGDPRGSKAFASTEGQLASGEKKPAGTVDSKFKYFCPDCKVHGHSLAYCPTFKAMNLDARMQYCQQHHLHFRCLERHKKGECVIPESRQKCSVDATCKYLHHPLLHGAKFRRRFPPSKQETGKTGDTSAASLPTKDLEIKGCTLRLCQLYVRPAGRKDKIAQTVALLDQGSSRSYVDEDFYRAFNIAMRLHKDATATLHGSKSFVCADVPMEVSRDGKTWFLVRYAKTMKDLRLPGPELKWRDFVAANPEFNEVEIDNVSFDQIRMLIGAELEEEMLPLEEPNVRIKKEGILALKTQLGWTIGGDLQSIIGTNAIGCFAVGPEMKPNLDKIMNEVLSELRRFNDMEAIGIEPRKLKLSRGGEEDQASMDKTTSWNNGRIRTQMLWQGKFSTLPNSEITARKRLNWLHQDLRKKGILDKYTKTITTDLEKGYVRKLSQQEARELRSKVHWFLPHFVVVHPDKPDRPRRVLDCAAKTDGVSLNSLLRTGPNNLADLTGVVQRFRVHKKAIGADVTEMFSQVEVFPEDQKMLAFLWNEDPNVEPDIYVNTRHVFGAKCSPAIATNAIRYAVERSKPDLLQTVIKQVYMDDFMHSAPTEEEAIRMGKEVRDAMGESSFCLRKWIANCKGILAAFPQEELAPSFVDLVYKEDAVLPTLKALGLKWDANSDTFGYSTRLKPEPPKNVAQALGQLASVYDLLQLVGPFLMKAKLMLQSFHLSGKGWTDALDNEQLEGWMTWVHQLPLVATLTIPRWFGFAPGEPLTMNVFSDASEDGYGAVGIFTNDSGVRSFISAKGRVINKRRPPTIPRSELQALVVGTRLAETAVEQLKEYLNIQRTIFWVDSAVVYYWANNKDKDLKDYNIFVGNRLGEVFETFGRLKDFSPEVRWLDTKSNPADLISRGCDGPEFKEQFQFWISGPDFLGKSEDQWPTPPPIPEKEPELRKYLVSATVQQHDQFQNFKDLAEYIRCNAAPQDHRRS